MKSQKINQISINKSTTILQTLKKMDELSVRLLLVMDGDTFISLVSIGDLQRAIIKNLPLTTHVNNVFRKNIKVANNNDDYEIIKANMLANKIECMPVLDENDQLVNVYFWEDVFPVEVKRITRNLQLPVVIMAGGKGTRLKPITNILPKPLIPVGEKTILENIMDRFTDVGCNQLYISVNYKAEMIKHYFDTLNNSNYKITYLKEEKPLGTAGSLYLLKDKISKTFFVSNCDIIIDADYSEILQYHKDNHNELTIIAALKHYPIPYGTIESGVNGSLVSLIEKPELTFKINSGMYILEPHLLNEVPKNEFFHITDLIENIQKRKGKVGVFPVSEGSWKDIGEWEKLNIIFKNNK